MTAMMFFKVRYWISMKQMWITFRNCLQIFMSNKIKKRALLIINKIKQKEFLMRERKYYFQKLTPVNNADISVYEEAMDFIFENSDVKNVAISGAYGAGKSSILESYKIKHKKRFVHISLAHFRNPKQENHELDESIKESILEGKILNQLIHQIPTERIPQTNFRVKKSVNPKNPAVLTGFASLFIGSIIFLLLLSNVTTFIEKLSDNWVKMLMSPLSSLYAPIFASLICIACSIILIFFLIRAQKNKNLFHKISLQGNEIEIFGEQDDSYFDKYLNEVLYLFENIEADVVVFEDMDRFNSTCIFERLREVNTLINIYRKKNHDFKYLPLRFFYLLRDDIFVSKDRTKFFDFIVPIVPIVDSSNSYEQFLKHLKEGNLLDNFDKNFLQSLSLYVDDMRILKNIYNEFVVYIHRLNITELDWNKMLAIISYKNLFPRDFSWLQLSRGFVFELFAQKPRLIKEAVASAQEQRQAILNRIERAKNETLISLQELADAYAAKGERLSQNPYVRNTKEYKEQIKQNETELAERKQAIQDMHDGNLPNLEAQLTTIERDILLTHSKSLKDLITRDNIDAFFTVSHTNAINEIDEFKEIKSSNYFALLKFLIFRGYIDESYIDYMTYFYDDRISASDKIFLRRVTDRRGAEYTYVLLEPQKVVESPVIRTVDFEQEETLNFDLLDCLLLNENIHQYATYLKTLITQIRESKNFDFVSKYYDKAKAFKQFVIKFNIEWPDFFSIALRDNAMPSEQIRKYSIDTLYFSNEETIATVNINNCLSEYISNSQDYLAIPQPNIDRLVSGFSIIGVSFVTIEYENANKSLFYEVYRQSLYCLTFDNITLMLKIEYAITNESDIIYRNYTMIQSNSDSPLAIYISKNINKYVEIVLNNCNGKISDDEIIAIRLLNNTDIEIAAKEQYIRLLSTIIFEITKISEPSLWTTLIIQGKIAFSASNFINYFLKHGIDVALTNYINDTTSEIDFSNAEENFGEELAERLFDAVAICNDIATDKYKKILIDLRFCFDNFDADKISDEKFKILISNEILQIDADTLEFVRNKYSRHQFIFIRHNLDKYLALQTAEVFRLNEAIKILTWNIEDDKKINLLGFTKEPIPLVDAQYSDAVNAYIITHNLESNDKPFLYMNFAKFGKQTREAIASLAVSSMNEILTKKMEIDDALLSILLQSSAAPRDKCIELFIMSIPKLNEDMCKTHFDELGLSDLKGIFTKNSGRRNYEKNSDVTKVLGALKLHNWIYEFHDDTRNNDRYIVVKNKPRNEPVILD